jgi:hypothetical protein
MFPLAAEQLSEAHGKTAVRLYLDTFVKFAGLDLSALDEAFASLDKVYPKTFNEYLRRFIIERQPVCREFAEGYNRRKDESLVAAEVPFADKQGGGHYD